MLTVMSSIEVMFKANAETKNKIDLKMLYRNFDLNYTTSHKQKQRRNTMTQVALTKEQEIEQAYAQLKAQEKQERDAVWERVEADQNKASVS